MKLTPRLATKLAKLIRKGIPIKYAVDGVGISRKTYYNWMNQGGIDHATPDVDTIYSKFYAKIVKAKSDYLSDLIVQLQEYVHGHEVETTRLVYEQGDDGSDVVVEKVVTKKVVRDIRAIELILRTQFSEVYGNRFKVDGDFVNEQIFRLLGGVGKAGVEPDENSFPEQDWESLS